MTVFSDAGDTGKDALISIDGGTVFDFQTGMGLFNGIVNTSSNELTIIGAHGCSNEEVSGSLGYHCDTSNTCNEVCVLTQEGSNVKVELLKDGYELSSFYRTKNSLGFGVTYVEEHILSVDFSEEALLVKTQITAVMKSNAASTTFYWQHIVESVLFVLLLINLVTRSLVLPILAVGLKGKYSRIRIKADLAGGLFTSPGVSITFWLLLTVCNSQAYFWLEGSGYPRTFSSEAFQAAMVASSTCVFISYVLGGKDIQLFASGSIVFLMSVCIRYFTKEDTFQNAASQITGLGQVLERTGFLTITNTTGGIETISASTNIADGMGLSGLEIFCKVFMVPLFYCLIAVTVFEFIAQFICYLLTGCRKDGKVRSSSDASIKAEKTLKRVGNYERVVLLSGAGRSKFAGLFARPIVTQFGTYYHASTIVEDNNVFWGPIIITIEMHLVAVVLGKLLGPKKTVELLINRRWYVGVAESSRNVLSLKENDQDLPEYLETYDYAAMSPIINGTPIQ